MTDQAQAEDQHTPGQAAARVGELARGLDFALCGIAPARASAYAEHFRQWLAAGKHGEMGYLADHASIRVDPRKLVEGARSVIVVADAYPVNEMGHEHEPPDAQAAQGRGRIAKYAWGDDYHKTIKKRLHQLADALAGEFPGQVYRSTVDTAPIFEREWATLAGLGWTGKHTLMIHPRHGSYFLLGTIVTTLDLQTSEQAGYRAELSPPTDHCGSCTRCIDACPTEAISPEGYSVDGTRCISYLTLEHRSAIDPARFAAMGDWIAGCDVCQDVCPHNHRRLTTKKTTDTIAPPDTNRPPDTIAPLPIHPRYTPRPPAPGLDLLEVLGWTEDDRRAVLQGSAIKRIKLDMMIRNALIVAGNRLKQDDNPALRKRIEAIANDAAAPEMVQATAREVLARLGI